MLHVPNQVLVVVDEKMIRRVTIMLDEDLIKKLRSEQAKIIQKTNSPFSFSRLLNDRLKESLKLSQKRSGYY